MPNTDFSRNRAYSLPQMKSELDKAVPPKSDNLASRSKYDPKDIKTLYRKHSLSDPKLGDKHSGVTVHGAKLSKPVIHGSTNTVEVRHLTNDEHDELAKKSPNILRSLQKSQSGFEQLRNEIESSPNGKVQQLGNGRSSAAIPLNHIGSLDQPATLEEIDARRIDSNFKALADDYQVMRDAITADLKNLPPYGWSREEAPLGHGLSMTQDELDEIADNIILRAGVATAGLNNTSVDRIRECLLTAPEFNWEGTLRQSAEFPATRALYDTVVVNDNIKVNTARLDDAAANIEKKIARSKKKGAALELLKSLINKNKTLTADIHEHKKEILGGVEPDVDQANSDMGGKGRFTRAREFASKLMELAKDMYKAAFSKEVFPAMAAEDGSEAGVQSTENDKLAQALYEMANINRSLARGLAPGEGRADFEDIGSEAMPLNDRENAFTVMWMVEALKPGGALELDSQSAEIIHRDEKLLEHELTLLRDDPIDTYKANIDKLRAAHQKYVENPNKETYQPLSDAIDNAYEYNIRIRSSSAAKQQLLDLSVKDGVSTIKTHTDILEKLSYAAFLEKGRLMQADNDSAVSGNKGYGNEDDGDAPGILDVNNPAPDVVDPQQSANAGYEIDSHIEELENFMQRLTESLDQLSALETKYLKGDQLRMGPRNELHNTSKQIGDTAKALIKACNQRRSEGFGQRNSPKGLNETALKKYENDANSAMKQVSEIEKSIFAYPMSEQERAELQEQISRGARGVSYADVVDDD